jgi:hypothetical protein
MANLLSCRPPSSLLAGHLTLDGRDVHGPDQLAGQGLRGPLGDRLVGPGFDDAAVGTPHESVGEGLPPQLRERPKHQYLLAHGRLLCP